MKRPDFLVIGAIKAATSTVCAYLEDHPGTFMVRGRDPNFFSYDENWISGPEAYLSLFKEAEAEQLKGEGSNMYTSAACYPDAAPRMASFCPDAKLIYMVREPVGRIVSHWIQARADRGDEIPANLSAAVRADPDRFVDPSFYWRQVSCYRACYPDNQIMIGFVEDLEADPTQFFNDLCTFLDIDPLPVAPRGVRNRSAGKSLTGPLYDRLKRLPGAGAAARLLPGGFKRRLRERVFSRPVTNRPELAPELAAELRASLRPDARALLAHCAKPADFWKI